MQFRPKPKFDRRPQWDIGTRQNRPYRAGQSREGWRRYLRVV